MFTVELVNQSAKPEVTPAWLDSVASAITAQLELDFCPVYGLAWWHVDAHHTPDSYKLVISDVPDAPNVEGYHDDNGTPAAKVFHIGTLDDLSTTISHEVLEMVRDQDAAGYRLALNGTAYADEACDAVEDTGYFIGGVRVSNFVTPAWYVEGSKGPWDHMGVLHGPLQQTSGGYTIELKGGQVSTNPPEAKLRPQKAHALSRTWRRIAASGFVLGLLFGCATGKPSFLNPDPINGGACRNGDQLATFCNGSPYTSEQWCCTVDESCGNSAGECDLQEPLDNPFTMGMVHNSVACDTMGRVWHCPLTHVCGGKSGQCVRTATWGH